MEVLAVRLQYTSRLKWDNRSVPSFFECYPLHRRGSCVDWDVSLKTQLQDFALGSRFLTSNTSLPHDAKAQHQFSPYGNVWDVLNLGHCGGGQHQHLPYSPAAGLRTFRIFNDPTTPPPTRIHTPNGAPNAKE
jgi:hypothetical protein